MQCSDRYGGARPFRHWWTVTASLKRTRSGTSSQCSWLCSIWPRPRWNFRVPVITRAAAFNIRCNLSVAVLGAPARTVLLLLTRKLFRSTRVFQWQHYVLDSIRIADAPRDEINPSAEYSDCSRFLQTVADSIHKARCNATVLSRRVRR